MAFIFFCGGNRRNIVRNEIEFEEEGLDEFERLIKEYAEKASADRALDAIEIGAKEFLNDLLKLPKPRSGINKAGYTHLVDSFALEREKDEIKAGWGKYYGPMIERGTKKMAKRAHLVPLFEQNKEKYYKKMTEKIFG